MKHLRYCRILAFALIFSTALTDCSNHYAGPSNVVRKSKYPAAIAQAKKDKRYLVLHSGVNVYSITSVEVDKAKQQMTVQLDKVDSLHLVNISNPEVVRLKPDKGSLGVLPEMHVYMRDSISYTLDEPHTIILDKVARMKW